MLKYKHALPIVLGLATGLVACASQTVPASYIETPVLDRYNIDVTSRTETLEIFLDQDTSQLTQADRRRMTSFFRAYRDHGHGQVRMLLPESTPNQQFAVGAVAEAREVAFAAGVNFDMIEGGAKYAPQASMILSFTVYETVKPDCSTFATVDFGATRTNNDLPTIGCSVRTNMAAMIADPSDLLGARELDPADSVRRQTTFEQYRAGETTAAERNNGESGTVSDAVQDQ